MLVLSNVIAARFMEGRSFEECIVIAIGVLVITVTLSSIMWWIIAVSGIPDIVVTLAASFSYAGLALWVLPGPGGGTSPEFQELLVGGLSDPVPSILVIVLVLTLVWLPLSRSRWGTAIYAIGSDRRAAFLTGVSVARTRILAYAVGGLLSGMAGLVTTAFTGRGEPRESIGAAFTLSSVAAVVLGGVLLRGGVGGLLGPVLAALSLGLIPPIMLGLGVDPAYAEIVRGVVIILVVMVGGLLTIRRGPT
jgi:ribose transport system permease protein